MISEKLPSFASVRKKSAIALGTKPSVTSLLAFAPTYPDPLSPAGIGVVPSLAPGILRNDRDRRKKDRSFSPT